MKYRSLNMRNGSTAPAWSDGSRNKLNEASACVCGHQLDAPWTGYLLWALCGCLAGVQGVAGVLENLAGATGLVLLATQTADKEQLGGALRQGGFGLFGQEVAVPLLTLRTHRKGVVTTVQKNMGGERR